MSIATLILGESGTGKTCSLRNLDPSKCLLIQPVRKPLPFKSQGWKEVVRKGDGGNVFVSSSPEKIMCAMARTSASIVIVDDWQYILSVMFMAKRNERGFDKFTDIGGAGYDIVRLASNLENNKRVYILAHSEETENGRIKIKTIGRMLDEKIVIEGLFTTVLRTKVDSGRYLLSTRNSGFDTVKSPMGLFDDDEIDNDIEFIDERICDYFGIQ